MKHFHLIAALLFVRIALPAQTPVDFSGTWILDNAKSDTMYREYKVTGVIKQTPQTISIERTFIDKSNDKSVMPALSYTLDGNEKTEEQWGGINKSSAKWSPDKKTLTITETRSVNNQLFGSTQLYNLSPDGKIITILVSDINPEGPKMKEVYNRSK